ncbi:MAG: glycosyltransferase family 2 protein [Acidobacteriota bacterium]
MIFPTLAAVTAPVALILFNRPEPTGKVFAAIRQARPTNLIVIADGPRANKKGEAEVCAAARTVTENVDWPCRVVRHYADENMGCRNRVASGLDLVFNEFDHAIILEDDCVPEPSFFRFCEELLERYHQDERVMAISGDNFLFGNQRIEYSYYFSRYPHVWGWATWRRAWQNYDARILDWPQMREQDWLHRMFQDRAAVKFWQNAFQSVYEGRIDTWDYQWTYACWRHGGLTALPNANLISNIGFGLDATHTRCRGRFSNMTVTPLAFPLSHPSEVARDEQADAYTQRQNFNLSLLGKARRVIKRILP